MTPVTLVINMIKVWRWRSKRCFMTSVVIVTSKKHEKGWFQGHSGFARNVIMTVADWRAI